MNAFCISLNTDKSILIFFIQVTLKVFCPRKKIVKIMQVKLICKMRLWMWIIFYVVFVCLGFIVSLENFSHIWRRHHYRWRAANFYLCLALMAIEQWGFFSVPHLVWHGASVYNDHLRRPVTLTLIAERLSRLGFEHPTRPTL